MRLTFLGTGTSMGVPYIGCGCEVCRSNDPRDHRLRCSVLIDTPRTRILIDTSPDFRQQMLRQEYRRIDGVLLTHIHYDHVGGMDDIRPFCKFGGVNVYADERTSRGLMASMPYCFTREHYPGSPQIRLHTICPHRPLAVNEVEIMPVTVFHDKLPILGYRMGKLAYITDMKTMDGGEMSYLRGVEVLVVNALRFSPPHHSHQCVDDALRFAGEVGARRTFLTHVCHDIGLYEEASRRLPEGTMLAYDGLTVEV